MAVITETYFVTDASYADAEEFQNALYGIIGGIPGIVAQEKANGSIVESWTMISPKAFKIERRWENNSVFDGYKTSIVDSIALLAANGIKTVPAYYTENRT